MASEADHIVINVAALSGGNYQVTLKKSDRWKDALHEVIWQSPSIKFPPHIKSSADVDTNMISRALFNKKLICPEVIVGQIGLSESEPSVVFVIYAFSAGMTPPTELVDEVQYRIISDFGESVTKILPEKSTVRCMGSSHEQRSEISCGVCGHLPYFASHLSTAVLFVEGEIIFDINIHLHTSYAYPNQPPIFSLSVDTKLSQDCFKVFDSNHSPVLGTLTQHNAESLSWTPSAQLPYGTYQIEFNEADLPFL